MFQVKFKYKTLCLLVLLIALNYRKTYSQNEEEDFKKISSKFHDDKVTLHQQVNYYDSYESIKPIESNNTILKKDGNKVYLSAFSMETIINNGISLLIDHQSKTILLDKNDGSEFISDLDIDFITLKETSFKIDYKQSREQASYTFYFKEGDQVKTEIWFDKINFEIIKIVAYMRYPLKEIKESIKKNVLPRVEILVTNFKVNCEFDTSTFEVNNFITDNSGKVIPANKYKEYHLIDNIRY